MGDAVNVIVVVVFVFLVFSLVVSGINEGLIALFAIRSKVLWKVIGGFALKVDASQQPVLRLRDVLRLPLAGLMPPTWLSKRDVSTPEANANRDPRPLVKRVEDVEMLDKAGSDNDERPVPSELLELNVLFPSLVLTETRPFDTGRNKTRIKHVSPDAISEAILQLGVHAPVVAEARTKSPAPDAAPDTPPANEVGVSAEAAPMPTVGDTIDDTLKQGQQFLDLVLNAVRGTQLEKPVRAAIAEASGDVEQFRKSIERWFDVRMEALSRLFKMWSRWFMLVVGLVVAAVMNVNPITTVTELRNDSALAEVTADQAAVFIADATEEGSLEEFCSATSSEPDANTTSTTTAVDRLKKCYSDVEGFVSDARTLPPPLEFDGLFWSDDEPLWGWNGYILGVILGGVALSLGAPFWFDTLRRIMSLRR